MNPVLELRWKIAMLRLSLDACKTPHHADTINGAHGLINDLTEELRTQERFWAEAQADDARRRAHDDSQ